MIVIGTYEESDPHFRKKASDDAISPNTNSKPICNKIINVNI